ncbi:metal ABC transporter permease [bacterium]|nr:metal ABC transporter permease [bacterium]
MWEVVQEPFFQMALLNALLTGCLCGYLGVFVVLKRIVFVSVALSQMAALGVAVGFFMGIYPRVSAMAFTMLGIVLLAMPYSEKNTSRESILGYIYAMAAVTAVVLIAKNPIGEAHGLDLVCGNVLYTTQKDLIMLIVIVLAVVVLHLFYFKEFIFVSFDRDTAQTTGIKPGVFEFLLYISFGLIISVSMQTSGVMFIFASLVIPAMIGLCVARHIFRVFFSAVVSAAVCVTAGFYVSYVCDLPSSSTIVLFYGVLFLSVKGITFLAKK